MLELTKQKALVVMVSHNAEMHGKEPKPISYIKLAMIVSNDVLSFFDGGMKAAFYKKDPEKKQEELLAGQLTLLKFPKIQPFDYDYKGAGFTFILHYGIDGKSDITLGDCRIDSFKFEMQQGGSVLMKFKIGCHPDDLQSGRLDKMIKQHFEITLIPPDEEQQQNAA